MSHSPYGRNPKTAAPSPPPRPATTPEEPCTDCTGQEPGPFQMTPEEVAAVIAMRDASERWHLDPAEVAQLAARGFFLASDLTTLAEEIARIWTKLPADVKASYSSQLDVAASKWLHRADAPKRTGPDEGRPQ